MLIVNTMLASGAFTVSELQAEKALLLEQEQQLTEEIAIASSPMLLEERGDVVEEAHLCRFSKEFGNFSHHQITGPMLSVGRAQFLLLLDAYRNDAMLRRMVK